MTTTTMHFGPEWMRTKGSARPAPSPPLTATPAPPGTSTYSALVTPATNAAPERRDVAHPFRYSREEMLRIYKEGGGRGGLGLEVERWEGIVREVGYDPVGLKEMSDSEKKLFAGSLNSEIRRRQSTDVLSPLATSLGDRPKLGHAASAAASPMRERIGTLMGRRRDSTDQAPLSLPRKLSLSSMQGPLASPREAALPSPRTRIGLTPGFDGVLSDSWSSRRRGESTSKTATDAAARKEREASDSGNEAKEPEPVHDTHLSQPPDSKSQSASDAPPGSPSLSSTNQINDPPVNKVQDPPDSLNGGMVGLSLGDNSENTRSPNGRTDGDVDGTPPKPMGSADLASIEWSYLDPQGQVQGPFRADVMQRWHDEGYFTPDLLMKRAQLDSEWTSVGEMLQRAGSNPIFLTPGVTNAVPPGLSRRLDALHQAPALDRERASPFQPVPTAPLRTSALDPYLHNGSSASASPSSSFGAARFVNGSPDLSTFEVRSTNHIFTESPVGPRLAGLSAMPASPLSLSGQRRPVYDVFDPVTGLRSPFANAGASRVMPSDGLVYGATESVASGSMDPATQFSSSHGIAGVQRNLQDHIVNSGHAGHSDFTGADSGVMGGMNNHVNMSRLIGRDLFNRSTGDDPQSPLTPGGAHLNGAFPANGHPIPQSQSFPYSSHQDARSLNTVSSFSDRQTTASSHPVPMNQHPSFVPTPNYPGSHSQWPLQGSPALRRPGPFDPDYPTANNTIITGPLPVSRTTYGRSSRGTTFNDHSPWNGVPSQSLANDGWTEDSNSLTVANLGQHNQQQQQEDAHQQTVDVAIIQTEIGAKSLQDGQQQTTPYETGTAAPLPSVDSSRVTQKARRKSSTQPATTVPQPTIIKAPAVQPVITDPPSPTPPTEPKPAWAKEDESKVVKPGITTLSLREIQEAEMKKLEARKAAERERERAARATSGVASGGDDFQPFTTSWGLPTSQAGAARITPTAKDSQPGSATTPSTPVWTNTPKPQVAKQSMKEIQEEEEKRKKQAAKEKETVAAAAKRGYAESTIKTTSSTPTSGGAWTTVGTGGKASGSAVPTTRPAIPTSSSSAKIVPSVSSATTSTSTGTRTAPTIAAVTRPSMPSKAGTSKADDFPAPPSHEFLKWLSDSLKGLNSSVNFEEITSMLLSFPLDPDPSTVEIISDLIYASSTTLDGRRFASDFVSRRKADAASRSKNGLPPSSSSKPLSIAEVVKTQPKPAQNEWVGFKVVNKKKKGARA